MSGGHRITYEKPVGGKHFAYCSCRTSMNQHDSREELDAEIERHMANVTRAQRALSTGTPSLTQQRDHYRKMQKDPEVSAADAHMWGVLADEIDKRLGTAGGDHRDTPLF